jgi:hypothetical protein
MNRFTDNRVLAAAFVAIILVGVITILISPTPPAPTLSVRSPAPDGTMALSLWLEQSGYRVRQVLSNPIRFGDMGTLFVLHPLYPYSDEEALRIREWVEEGHTLIVAGNNPFVMNGLLEAFDVSMRYLPSATPSLSPALPTLNTPPVDVIEGGAAYVIDTARSDIVPHVTSGGDNVLISFRQGAGTVWVSGMTRPFTNQGLQDEGSARLILNFLADVPEGATIGFDEARHGFQEASSSLSGWLVSSPAGWGILSALILTLTFLALRGRRFGQPVPIMEERLRREPVEYIQAMANLFRRSGQRSEMLKHYGDQLRRRLSERYAVDTRVSDDELVKMIAYRDANIDPATLRGLLGRLSQNKLSEQELLDIVIEVDNWLRYMA